MQRDGWTFTQWLDFDHYGRRTKQPAISEKTFLNGKMTLRVEKYYDPTEQLLCYVVDGSGQSTEMGVGSWADIDQQGRLVFSSDGKLYAAVIAKHRVELNQLADFTDSKPSRLQSPPWARRW
jgi:hypothetical protein